MRRIDSSLGAAFALSVALHATAGLAVDRVLAPGGGAAGRSIPDAAPAGLHATLTIMADSHPRKDGTPCHDCSTLTGTAAAPLPPGEFAPAEVVEAGDGAGTGEGAGLFDFPQRHYFGVDELDHKPAIIGKVVIAYPATAPLVAHGRVVLELFIDETGRVDRVQVEAKDLPATLQELARDKFAQARFRPGIRKDQLVRSRLRIEVVFEGRR